MTKKEFLKELKKSFGEVDRLTPETGLPGGTQEYYVWVRDSEGKLFAENTLHFYVENEDTPDERAFTPHPEQQKQKEFNERFRKKVESFRLS